MKYVKTFETFNFSQTLPVVSKADLNLYYHCDGCNALWKQMNRESEDCKFCHSNSIEELSKDEWYETVGDRIEDDEREDMESEKAKEEDDFLDLYKIKSGDVD